MDLKSGPSNAAVSPPHILQSPLLLGGTWQEAACQWLLATPGFVEQLGGKKNIFHCSFKYQKYHYVPMLIFPISKVIWEKCNTLTSKGKKAQK